MEKELKKISEIDGFHNGYGTALKDIIKLIDKMIKFANDGRMEFREKTTISYILEELKAKIKG